MSIYHDSWKKHSKIMWCNISGEWEEGDEYGNEVLKHADKYYNNIVGVNMKIRGNSNLTNYSTLDAFEWICQCKIHYNY